MLFRSANTLALAGAREKGVAVTIDLAASVCHVLADRIQIQQVVVNLVRNAVEAMDGCKRRELWIRSDLVVQDAVEVLVADTGPGLPPHLKDRLFQPFVSTKASGMGVGLSICRTIIEAHGGKLTAAPNENGGTTFRFTLPCVELEPDVADKGAV